MKKNSNKKTKTKRIRKRRTLRRKSRRTRTRKITTMPKATRRSNGTTTRTRRISTSVVGSHVPVIIWEQQVPYRLISNSLRRPVRNRHETRFLGRRRIKIRETHGANRCVFITHDALFQGLMTLSTLYKQNITIFIREFVCIGSREINKFSLFFLPSNTFCFSQFKRSYRRSMERISILIS